MLVRVHMSGMSKVNETDCSSFIVSNWIEESVLMERVHGCDN